MGSLFYGEIYATDNRTQCVTAAGAVSGPCIAKAPFTLEIMQGIYSKCFAWYTFQSILSFFLSPVLLLSPLSVRLSSLFNSTIHLFEFQCEVSSKVWVGIVNIRLCVLMENSQVNLEAIGDRAVYSLDSRIQIVFIIIKTQLKYEHMLKRRKEREKKATFCFCYEPSSSHGVEKFSVRCIYRNVQGPVAISWALKNHEFIWPHHKPWDFYESRL
jgi:hypothetical protein